MSFDIIPQTFRNEIVTALMARLESINEGKIDCSVEIEKLEAFIDLLSSDAFSSDHFSIITARLSGSDEDSMELIDNRLECGDTVIISKLAGREVGEDEACAMFDNDEAYGDTTDLSYLLETQAARVAQIQE